MVLVSVNNATEFTSSNKRGVLEPIESNDEDSDSDDSAYADFLAMLQSPNKEVVVEAEVVVQPVKAMPVAVSKKEKKQFVSKKPVKTPAITGGTSFAAMAPTPQKKASFAAATPSPKKKSEVSVQKNASTKATSWGIYVEEKMENDDKENDCDDDYADFLAMLASPSKKEVVSKKKVEPVVVQARAVVQPVKAVPVVVAKKMKAKSLGRGTVSFDSDSVESIEEIQSAKATPKAVPARRSSIVAPKATPRAVPARAASTRVVAQPRPEPNVDLPRAASMATLHFAKQQIKKAEDMEAIRSVVKDQEPVEPLPFDHFTKLGEAETEAKAKEAWELAEASMPIGIAYFTAKGEEDRIVREAEQKELSEQEMSTAVRHFVEIAAEKEAKAAEAQAGAAEVMPAAIQHFTVADRAEKEKKRQSIAEMRENPPAMSLGQGYFTTKDRAEKDKTRQEIQDMVDNPPPASVATEHFNKVHSVRKLEIEAVANEPAPRAIEYFTQKANEEKSKRDLMLEELNENPPEPSVATQHFAEQEKKKAEDMDAARSQIRQTSDVEPLPVNYFTKQGEAEMEAKAKEARELSESHMPIGIAYFTKKGAEDKIANEASLRQLSEQESSVATRHFANIAAEKEAKAAEAQVEDAEVMPAAIQHFTVADRAEKEKKRQSIAEMKENPPAMSLGQGYFTTKDRAEKEKTRQEIQDMIDNPPAASVATEHFNKVHSIRKLEIEAMANEPAPRAIEYFTQKANEEKSKRDLMLEELNETPPEPSLATQHFAEQEKKKAEENEAQRVLLRQKANEGLSQRAQVNWQALTKQQAPQVPAY